MCLVRGDRQPYNHSVQQIPIFNCMVISDYKYKVQQRQWSRGSHTQRASLGADRRATAQSNKESYTKER